MPERQEDGFLDKGLEGLSHNFVTGTLEELVKWARARSVMPATSNVGRRSACVSARRSSLASANGRCRRSAASRWCAGGFVLSPNTSAPRERSSA